MLNESEAELLLNPSLEIWDHQFRVAVRGRRATYGRVDPERHPQLSYFLERAAALKQWTSELKLLALPHLQELVDLGIIVQPHRCPRQVSFSEIAADQTRWRHLVPVLSNQPTSSVPAGSLKIDHRIFAPATMAEARRSLLADGFAIARGLLSPVQLAPLRAYFRELMAEGYFRLDEVQVLGGRSYIHNDGVGRSIQAGLLGWVSEASGERVKPSYSFYSAYLPGAELPRHTDRDQCAWNVSLVIDADPETTLEEAWPLCFQFGEKIGEAKLQMGDAVLYRGTETPHWRPRIAQGHSCAVLLGHYVNEDFTGSLV